MRLFLALLILCLPFSAFAAESDVVELGESRVKLISSVETLKGGDEFLIGVHIELAPHWHTYTYDPGDAGIPFDAKWKLPKGFKISKTYFPPHEQFDEAGLTTYGFSNEVVFTYKVTAPEEVIGSTEIMAKVEYLVCEKICIPQSANLTLRLPAGAAEKSLYAGPLADWHARSKLEADWGDVKKNSLTEKKNDVELPSPNPSREREGDYTEDARNIEGDYQISQPDGSVLLYILLALLGGIILNLMPCVFPVLSLKALTIAKHVESSPVEVRREGIVYTLGILTCFIALAGMLLILQAAGTSIGWGFQFQSPGFVAIMALLLFFIGLNLSGMFELPTLLGGLAAKIGSETSARNSYFTGVLAALVATPCTAPFMAPAVGFALSQPAAIALLIFISLGFGLALPFLLISFIPACRKLLPKPGKWMETFKKFLAFPMYLSAIWLLWVLGTQSGADAIIGTLMVAILIIFLLWAKARCNLNSRFCVVANLFIIAALLALLAEAAGHMQQARLQTENAIPAADSSFVSYSADTLAELRKSGTPVFVNATASWCITCQVNYKIAIQNSDVQEAFKQQGVVYMVADWTNRNEDITRFLSQYGYKGVPLYVYYGKNGEEKILPQILTPGLILENIGLSN